MDLNFATALAALGANAAFRIANAARPSNAYLFATLLPEKPDYDYHVESGFMTVRTTMAGLVGMDSPYPPGGQVEVSAFSERTAKIANQVFLPEYTMRKLQAMLMQLQLSGQPTVSAIQTEALNFLNKVVIQAHMDTAEWLRAQALVTGAIAWTFNGKTLAVDYGIPGANKLTTRTGEDAYHGNTSKFWTDVREAKRLLKYDVRACLAHPTTIDSILYNDYNKLQVLSKAGCWPPRRPARRRRFRSCRGASCCSWPTTHDQGIVWARGRHSIRRRTWRWGTPTSRRRSRVGARPGAGRICSRRRSGPGSLLAGQ